MHKVFSPDDLNDTIMCPKCSWKGKGTDIKKEELLLTDALELFCPECATYLGMMDREDERGG